MGEYSSLQLNCGHTAQRTPRQASNPKTVCMYGRSTSHIKRKAKKNVLISAGQYGRQAAKGNTPSKHHNTTGRANGEQKQSSTSSYDRCIRQYHTAHNIRITKDKYLVFLVVECKTKNHRKKRLSAPRTPPRALVLPARVRPASPASLPLMHLLSPRGERCTAPVVRPILATYNNNGNKKGRKSKT